MKKLDRLRNSQEQTNKNIEELEKMGIKYVSVEEYSQNKGKYDSGIGMVKLKRKGLKGFFRKT